MDFHALAWSFLAISFSSVQQKPQLPQQPGLYVYAYVCCIFRAIPHNSKCRYGERGAADAKPKAQIILDAAKVSAASGGNSEPKQGQRSQSARGFCPRSTMRVPQPDIIEHFGNADAVPQPPKRCLSRKAGIVWCCLYSNDKNSESIEPFKTCSMEALLNAKLPCAAPSSSV